MLFVYPCPSESQVSSLYDKHYTFHVDTTALRRFKEHAQRILRSLHAMDPDARSLLDIGAGYGTFVSAARKLRFEPIGLEPAKNIYTLAKKNHHLMKNVGYEQFFRAHPSAAYDVVTLIHVIEHLHEPEKALRKIVSHVKPGGILYIETPNLDSHLFNVEGPDYTFLTPPDHLHLFSPRSLDSLVRSLNREVTITVKTYSYPEHFIGVARRIKRGAIGKSVRHPLKKAQNSGKHRRVGEAPARPFDAYIAPALTPLLNLGNKGSILQMYVRLS